MKPLMLVVCAGFVFATADVAVTQPARSVPRAEAASSKVTALLKQRRDTLKQLVKLAEERHRAGAGTAEAVLRASLQLQSAELELAKSRRERIAIHKRTVDLLRTLEKMAQQRAAVGAGRPDDVLSARAARLQAEIQMLREESSKPRR